MSRPLSVRVNVEALRSIRRLAGLSQYQLALQANVSEGLVGLIETGRRQPSAGNAEAIRIALETAGKKKLESATFELRLEAFAQVVEPVDVIEDEDAA